MSRYKKLIGNSIIFAIGNFGSKLINLIMVPLYTFALSPKQYGTVDLLITTVSLFLPVISVSIGEAVIRFAIHNGKDEVREKSMISNAFFINIISTLLLLILFPAFKGLIPFGSFSLLFLIQLILSQYQATFSQFVRGIGLVKEFAINGILMTVVTAGLNVLLLVRYSYGISGYLISIIIANLLSIIYLAIVSEAVKKIRLKYINIEFAREMIRYSLPLIPNMIMWWIINSSTRYLILYFCGATENGLYAVANKIPTVLTMLTTIFQQAWQLSAFEEYESEDKKFFFSETFQYYYQFLFIGVAIITPFVRPILTKVIDSAYIASWKIVPFLILAVIYQSFSSFLGTNYTAAMKTMGVFTSSLIGALISLVANIILLPRLGISGSGIGICFSFLVMFVIRYYDTKKIIGIEINKKLFLINNMLVIFQSLSMYLFFNDLLLLGVQFILLVCILLINYQSIISIFRIFRKSIWRTNK